MAHHPGTLALCLFTSGLLLACSANDVVSSSDDAAATPYDGAGSADARADAAPPADATLTDAPSAKEGDGASPEADSTAEAGSNLDAAIDAGDAGDAGENDAATDAAVACPGCIAVASANGPLALVADSTSIYWTDPSGTGGAVKKVPIGGLPDGGSPTILGSNQQLDNTAYNDYGGLAVDSTNAYWTTLNYVVYAPIDGSIPPRILAESAGPNGVAVDSTTIYWTDNGGPGLSAGSVMSMPIAGFTDGGQPTPLVTNDGNLGGIAVNASGVYWTQWPSAIKALLAGGGASPVTIASNQAGPAGIALSATQVFWTGLSVVGGGLFSAPLSGVPDGGAPVAFSSTPAGPNVATDAANVYWTAGGQILEAPLSGVPDGGAPRVLAANQLGVELIAVDPLPHGNVYWAATLTPSSPGGYVIFQIAK